LKSEGKVSLSSQLPQSDLPSSLELFELNWDEYGKELAADQRKLNIWQVWLSMRELWR